LIDGFSPLLPRKIKKQVTQEGKKWALTPGVSLSIFLGYFAQGFNDVVGSFYKQ